MCLSVIALFYVTSEKYNTRKKPMIKGDNSKILGSQAELRTLHTLVAVNCFA